MRLIDRYMARELVWPFLGGLATFVVMITGHVLFTVVDRIVEHGVGFPSVLRFVSLQAPFALVMSLPAASLLAASLALNRLASENELTAMRVGGAGLGRLLAPVVGLGLVASLGAVALGQWAVPWANHEAETMMQRFVAKRPALAFRPGKFTNTRAGLDFFAEEVNPEAGELRKLYVFQRVGQGPPLVTYAEQARFAPAGLDVGPGEFYYLQPTGRLTWGSSGGTTVRLGEFRFLPGTVARRVSDLSLLELRAQGAEMEQRHRGAGRPYAVEFHFRLSLAFASLAFAVLALPLTLGFGQGQSLVGVLVTLVLVFVYYVIMLWLRMAADAGRMEPFVAAWLENAVLLMAAGVLMWRQR